ncbi:MAG: diacylglycerol kinase family protein [Acidimicrobiales bacterium]
MDDDRSPAAPRPTSASARPSTGRRALAAVALVCPLVAIVLAAVAAWGNVVDLVALVVLLLVVVLAGWFAITRTGVRRLVALVVAMAAVVGVVALFVLGEHHGLALAIVVAHVAVSIAAAKVALGHDAASLEAAPVEGRPVGPASRPVLIMNLKSGGGKAERFHLEDACRARGIEPIILKPGLDPRELAVDAVERGADVIGMAGGDGSQALVASVAAEHGVAHVCIPAGTRNHFALDLGLDRDDVVGALDAFGDAVERRIDLAEVNGRVFVNNVSLGVYAKIVQSPDYRDAKRQTTLAMLPEMLGPDAPPFDLHFDGPDGEGGRRRPGHPGLEQPVRAGAAAGRVRHSGPPRRRHARHRRRAPHPGHRRGPLRGPRDRRTGLQVRGMARLVDPALRGDQRLARRGRRGR